MPPNMAVLYWRIGTCVAATSRFRLLPSLRWPPTCPHLDPAPPPHMPLRPPHPSTSTIPLCLPPLPPADAHWATTRLRHARTPLPGMHSCTHAHHFPGRYLPAPPPPPAPLPRAAYPHLPHAPCLTYCTNGSPAAHRYAPARNSNLPVTTVIGSPGAGIFHAHWTTAGYAFSHAPPAPISLQGALTYSNLPLRYRRVTQFRVGWTLWFWATSAPPLTLAILFQRDALERSA